MPRLEVRPKPADQPEAPFRDWGVDRLEAEYHRLVDAQGTTYAAIMRETRVANELWSRWTAARARGDRWTKAWARRLGMDFESVREALAYPRG
jgi:hypothetical protein